MANAYIAIQDAMIAAYKPVTSRLLRRLARDIDALGEIAFNTSAFGSTSSSSLVTIETIPLFIPDRYIGESGTQITLVVICETFETGSGGVGTYRIQVDGNNSSEETVGVNPAAGDNAETKTFTVTYTPTANTAITINLQAKTSGGASFAEMTSGRFGMASLPRAA